MRVYLDNVAASGRVVGDLEPAAEMDALRDVEHAHSTGMIKRVTSRESWREQERTKDPVKRAKLEAARSEVSVVATDHIVVGFSNLSTPQATSAAIVGIIWLVPVFGVYFARRLAREGASAPAGRTAGCAALGLLAFVVLAAAGFQRPTASPSQFLLIGAGAVLGIAVTRSGWPRLWLALLAYGFAARIPVAVVILLGILNGLNTHYDTPPPGLPDLDPLARWLAIGVIPQFTIWVAVTVILGTLSGVASLALVPPRRVPYGG